MSYQVLARKWRPQTFTELVGQEKVLAALLHGLNENRLHHAYLFTGTRGVGKTTVARILAKCLNCEKGISGNPCGECEACVEIRDGRYVDMIEIDAASRTKVEDTRDLLDNIQYAPAKGRFKVYLIDEVHMLSTHSFNALLKTLEEPPEHVKFLLATTDPQKLPITVLSRCLQFHLKNIPIELIVDRLRFILKEENIAFEDEALFAIAKAAEGSLRDALSLTDQAIGQGNGSVQSESTLHMLGVVRTELLYQLAESLIAQNNAELFRLLETIASEPVDYSALLKLFAEFWYEVSLKQILESYESEEWKNDILTHFAKTVSPAMIQLFYEMALQGKKDLPFAPEPRIGFNMTILRMLAFRPLQITGNNIKPEPAPAIPALRQNAGQTPVGIQRSAPVTAAPATSVAKPAETTPLAAQPQTTIASLPPTEKIPIENWDTLLNTLPLGGMLKQIVKNTSFDRLEGNVIYLKIGNAHQNLFNENAKNKLISTLQTYYEQPFSLQIIGSETPIETPASKAEEARKAHEAQLQEKLNQDPNIDFIKNNFNGTIKAVQLT